MGRVTETHYAVSIVYGNNERQRRNKYTLMYGRRNVKLI